ncbi:MAG: autotransporter outer membrane beta-barrel domain-containing protein, partial [Lutibacter sp.]|nr:autotransporter outer membrane beta-barrel domain-containing protein [Lutibacter sp.]
CSSAFVNAQEISDNAIGLRLGDNNGLGTEISYQKQLSNVNRLELDLGFRSRSNDSDAFKLSGIYQWVWQIDGGFNWYAGFGAGIGSWENNNINSNDNDGVFLNAAGNIGIEYNFDAPILISLDVRPEIGLLGNYSDTDLDLALSVRYQF